MLKAFLTFFGIGFWLVSIIILNKILAAAASSMVHSRLTGITTAVMILIPTGGTA